MLNHIFSPENRFFNFINKIMDALIIGILWVLFSLPVITAGAAFCGVFNFTIRQTYDEEGYVVRSFFKKFRKNLRQGTAVWLMILAGGSFLLMDLYLCLNANLPTAAEQASFTVLLCLLILLLITSLYVFPLLAMFEMSIRQLFHHALVMAVSNIFVTMLLLIMAAVTGFAIWLFPALLPAWAGFFMFLSSYLYRGVFQRYMQNN